MTWVRQRLLRHDTKIKFHKNKQTKKTDKLDFIRMNFCSSTDTLKRLEREATDQKGIFVEQVSAKKELSKLSKKQTNFLKWTRTGHFTRKIESGETSARTSLVIRKWK